MLIILVHFYVNLLWFFLLPGSESTFPKVDPDPAKCSGSPALKNKNTKKHYNKIQ